MRALFSAALVQGIMASTLIDPSTLPLTTIDSAIVNNKDDPVKLACVNWYGAHMDRFAVNGLDKVHIDEIAADIATNFNCVRLVFSLEGFYKDPMVADDVLSANPQLQGMTSMEVFDATVQALADAGVMIILNNHTSDAIWCCSDDDGNGLWHNASYNEEDWLNALIQMTYRYKNQPMVIGNDLRNEIRSDNQEGLYPTWGSGQASTDWLMSATNAGNKILKVNPNHLIFVEAMNYALSVEPLIQKSLHLDIPHRVVFSIHWYNMDFDFT